MTSSSDPRLQTVIAELFPPDLGCCASTMLPPDHNLLPEERAAIADMAPKRLAEYSLGRHCAHRAMEALGSAAAPVIKGEDRAPIWPTGLIGSISHCEQTAAAVVGRTEAYQGIGLDIEAAGELPEELRRLILRPDEDGDAKLRFSIKEAVYKCIYPTLGHYVDFQEMQIILGAEGRYQAVAHSTYFDVNLVKQLRGEYAVHNGLLISSAWLAV